MNITSKVAYIEGDNIVTKSKDNKFDAEKFLDDRKK